MVDQSVTKALNVTSGLGIPDQEVKPILENLLRVYDNDWTHIAQDNYRTLVDAYFEHKDNKVIPLLIIVLCLYLSLRGKKKIVKDFCRFIVLCS